MDPRLDGQFTAAGSGMAESPFLQPFQEYDFTTAMYGEDSDLMLQHSLQANLGTIQEGFKVQQSCMSETFFCHDLETFGSLIASLKQDPTAPLTSSVLCEISAVAIVAGQYMRDSFEEGVLQYWYGRSGVERRKFDGSTRPDLFQIRPASALTFAWRWIQRAPSKLLRCWVSIICCSSRAQQPPSSVSKPHDWHHSISPLNHALEKGLSLSAKYLEDHADEDDFLVNLGVLSTVRTQRSLAFCNG